MTPERLAELEALAAAATPGPWDARYDGDGLEIGPKDARICHVDDYEGYVDDADLIAAARTAIPELIAALREAQAQAAELSRYKTAMKRHLCP